MYVCLHLFIFDFSVAKSGKQALEKLINHPASRAFSHGTYAFVSCQGVSKRGSARRVLINMLVIEMVNWSLFLVFAPSCIFAGFLIVDLVSWFCLCRKVGSRNSCNLISFLFERPESLREIKSYYSFFFKKLKLYLLSNKKL